MRYDYNENKWDLDAAKLVREGNTYRLNQAFSWTAHHRGYAFWHAQFMNAGLSDEGYVEIDRMITNYEAEQGSPVKPQTIHLKKGDVLVAQGDVTLQIYREGGLIETGVVSGMDRDGG